MNLRLNNQLGLFVTGSEESWSYSRLKTLRRCALEYKVRWLEGQERLFQPSYIDVQAGRLLHKIIREYYLSKLTSTPHQDLIDIYERFAPHTVNWKEDLRGESRVLTALRLFAYSEAASFRSIGLDVACKGPVSGQVFTGYADVIYERAGQPGLSGILEFKLNDVEVGNNDIVENFLQCIIYYLGLPKEFRPNCKRATIYVFDTGEQLDVDIEQTMIDRANELVEQALALANGPDFPPTLNPFCSSCGYQNLCPAFSKRNRLR